MVKKAQNNLLNDLPLAAALLPEVKAWADQGWQGATQTTYELLAYWFNRDQETDEKFHLCQQRAIETIIYCHEVLGIETLKQAFEKFAPEALAASAALSEEVQNLPFAKYCLKMATGTGKTWVLAALLVWQYFNALNNEWQGKYSTHFLLVAPGHEVLDRLLDMFLGKHDPKTDNRDKSKSDFIRPLFMPEGERFRNRFNLRVLEPSDIRPNFTPPDEPFVYITNWQQFRLSESSSLWDQLTGADIEEQPRGEIIADFLSEYSDLIIFNDEAHHVHGAKTAKGEELVWRKFLTAFYERMAEKRGGLPAEASAQAGERGVFLQIDFSATPFYGSAEKKEYFPHIVYDFDLVEAMRAMLVKQIFLEERQAMTGEKIDDLDVRAERAEADSEHKRGQVIGVSVSQKLLLDIGRKKMEQIAVEFREKGLDKKPVLFVLAENTEVADLVAEHLANLTDERGRNYRNQILVIHSDKKGEMSDKDWKKYHQQLESLDEPEEVNPIRVVVSVLMLREGFDTQNVAVVVVLRSAKADLLLEQIVGRGVRLMFPEYKYPELADLKREAREDVMAKRPPKNSLDFLFVVEHPKFRSFYQELQKQGYAIGIGDSSGTETTGDLVLSEATPERMRKYDLSWPIQVYEQSPKFDFRAIDIAGLPKYSIPFETIKKQLSQIAITETNAETGGKIKTWKLDNKYFDYAHFLRQATMAVASEKGTHILTGKMADITGIIDEYVSKYIFGNEIDFQKSENYTVLNYAPLFDFVVGSVKRVILDGLGAIQYEVRAGKIGRLSDVKKIYVRESLSATVERCIYPLAGYTRKGEGFERDFVNEVLNKSAEVEAFGKIQLKKHPLNISYRDKDGIRRDYFPDFVIKTKNKMYIVETKAEDEMQKAEGNEKSLVVLKARAAVSWCKTASQVSLPDQPQEWEYFILSEKTFNENRQLGFTALADLGRLDLERLLAIEAGKLF